MAGMGSGSPVVGIDLGGTKILAGVIGAGNEILGRAKRPTPAKEGAEAILEAIVDCVDEALAIGPGRDATRSPGPGSARPGPWIPRPASSSSAPT